MSNIMDHVSGEMEHYSTYTSMINTHLKDIVGGFKQKCAQYNTVANQKKQNSDLKKIKKIKIPDMQEGVLKGYMILRHIVTKYGDTPLSKKVRGQANASMAGAIAFDTFCGRKKEWEILEYDYVKTVLDNEGWYLECPDHKTAATYGTIAKLLTPGLFQALLAYSKLHRPSGCKTFLVPAVDGALIGGPGA